MIYIILIKHRESGEVEVARECFLTYVAASLWLKGLSERPMQTDYYTFESNLYVYHIEELKLRR